LSGQIDPPPHDVDEAITLADRVLVLDGAEDELAAYPTGEVVGTPEQMADALLDYYDLGVSTFLIRGFDPLEDAVAYGRDLIPLVRDLVAASGANPARGELIVQHGRRRPPDGLPAGPTARLHRLPWVLV